jgi:TnsA endonuclease N terminal
LGTPSKQQFFPKNPEKYIGANINNIISRSSWEMTMMNYLDEHEMVLRWCSETVPSNTMHSGISGIPYYNPLAKLWSRYVPDFFVCYIVPNTNKTHIEIIEIKPLDEVPGFKGKVSKLKEARQIINSAKFMAAMKFCKERGWKFRIMTENELFMRPPR